MLGRISIKGMTGLLGVLPHKSIMLIKIFAYKAMLMAALGGVAPAFGPWLGFYRLLYISS